MQEKRYQGQRGTERDQPRDVLLKLRLTEKEADILNEVAERSNRPVSKIALSAINAIFNISAFEMLLEHLSEQRPDIKQKFEAFEQIEKGLNEVAQEMASKLKPDEPMPKDLSTICNLIYQIAATKLTLTRFRFGADDWIRLEEKKYLQQKLDL